LLQLGFIEVLKKLESSVSSDLRVSIFSNYLFLWSQIQQPPKLLRH